MNQLSINHTGSVEHQPYSGFVMNQLGINHTGSVGHQSYPGLAMNQLGINHTRLVGHQPYLGFAMNQLGINHSEPIGHQPYPGFTMNQLGINHTRPVGHQPYSGLGYGRSQQPHLLALRLILVFNQAAQYVVYGGLRFRRELCPGCYSFNSGGSLSSTDRLPNISLEVASPD